MHARRPIRSFVLRAGRVTAAQERALTELWPAFGLEYTGAPLDLDAAFGRSAPRCLEIGYGAGEVIGALAQAHPDCDYLGIEVHRSGVGRLLLKAGEAELKNLRLICHDAVEVLASAIPDRSFDEILIFFPDPWHKKRHHKRRLIDAPFVDLLANALRPQGIAAPGDRLAGLRRADAPGVQCLCAAALTERGRHLRAAAAVSTADPFRAARCAPGTRRMGFGLHPIRTVATAMLLRAKIFNCAPHSLRVELG